MRMILGAIVLLVAGALIGTNILDDEEVRQPPDYDCVAEDGERHQEKPTPMKASEGGDAKPGSSATGGELACSGGRADESPRLDTSHSQRVRYLDSKLAEARRTGSTDVTEAELRSLVRQGDSDVSIRVAMLIAYLDPLPTYLLQQLLADQDSAVEFYAVASLAKRAEDHPQGYEQLVDYCTRGNPVLAAEAVRGLARFGSDGAAEILRLVGDPRREVQSAVAAALGSLGREGADAAWALLESGEFLSDDVETICRATVQEGLDWNRLQSLSQPELVAIVASIAARERVATTRFTAQSFERAAGAIASCRPESLGAFIAAFLGLDSNSNTRLLQAQLVGEAWTREARLSCMRGLMQAGCGQRALRLVLGGTWKTWEKLEALEVAVEECSSEEAERILRILDEHSRRTTSPLLRMALKRASLELREH